MSPEPVGVRGAERRERQTAVRNVVQLRIHGVFYPRALHNDLSCGYQTATISEQFRDKRSLDFLVEFSEWVGITIRFAL